MEKSYVSMKQKICIVCGHTYDSGAILMDKSLKDSMEQKTITGEGLCPEHQKAFDNGYIALVGVDPNKSKIEDQNKEVAKIHKNNAFRTGNVLLVKRETFPRIFNSMEPPKNAPLVFCEDEALQMIVDQYNIVNPESPLEMETANGLLH